MPGSDDDQELLPPPVIFFVLKGNQRYVPNHSIGTLFASFLSFAK
jgi:hypothetical protein